MEGSILTAAAILTGVMGGLGGWIELFKKLPEDLRLEIRLSDCNVGTPSFIT